MTIQCSGDACDSSHSKPSTSMPGWSQAAVSHAARGYFRIAATIPAIGPATPAASAIRSSRSNAGGTSPAPIHGLRLGDVALVGLGGEAFVEYALHARARSAASSTMALGYTDGVVGYLPTAIAYEEGGYEPNAYKVFAAARPWDPALEGVIKGEIDRMLADLGVAR